MDSWLLEKRRRGYRVGGHGPGVNDSVAGPSVAMATSARSLKFQFVFLSCSCSELVPDIIFKA